MEQQITPLFLDYEQRRTSGEAQAADAQDEAELKALENRIKDRKEAEA
jgi:PBP1b-binding outer membrane lipoprotein LpoB